jgi:hypothetical protein
MKNLLKFFLFNDWTRVFGSFNSKREIQLTIEDYVTALEILSEADSIPHDFKSLLFHIFTDYDKKGFENMWNQEFVQRTVPAIEAIFKKALKNIYREDTEVYVVLEAGLEKLRQMKVDFSDYEEAKIFYKKMKDLFQKDEDKKWKEISELVDSWY